LNKQNFETRHALEKLEKEGKNLKSLLNRRLLIFTKIDRDLIHEEREQRVRLLFY
jgi:hypothetical protein